MPIPCIYLQKKKVGPQKGSNFRLIHMAYIRVANIGRGTKRYFIYIYHVNI